jgi:CDP-6-deoxy-D-xylo-4-hexulose-3-dehydrase
MLKNELQKISRIVENYFNSQQKEIFIPGKTRIPLAVPTFGSSEVIESIESLMSTWVSMGKKVKEFEENFASYIGVKYAIMVNSGSSANLLALSILSNPRLPNRIKPNEEIIVPAVGWSTTIYPIVNIQAMPVFVDVNMDYNININNIEKAITEKTRAIMPVHIMGYPCEIPKIQNIAKKNDLFLIEDCCESHGATINMVKVGSFGDIGTFSFFMSHHISTIEGGMIVTNNKEIANHAKVLRAHGWIREHQDKQKIAEQNPNIDPRFLFYNLGFNFRPTELQGAFGIHQLPKLESFIKIRRNNAEYWNNRLKSYSDYLILPFEKGDNRHVYFAYPLTIRDSAPFSKKEITDYLESKLIETRPLGGGNLVQQPSASLYRHKISGTLDNSKTIMDQSFFIGNHHEIGANEREYVANCFDEFISSL